MSAPRLFRVILEVSDLDTAVRFYSALLGGPGIRVSQERSAPQPVYLATSELDALHARARELNCLSTELVHDASAGEIVTRPWGERSFYAFDPDGNGLCFVDEDTVFTGR